jgi:glycosyltransferase involved in cell wall biosynthesis
MGRRQLAQEYRWLLSQEPAVVVICQGGISDGWEWLRFCRENALPFATIVQCNAEVLWPNDDFGEELAAGFQAARRVFCVSKHNLELLERQIGVGLQNAEVVWNPYCVPSGPPPVWPGDDGVAKLACVARLEPAAKGQDLLFRVLSLPQWRERPVEINLYGSGPCERSLRKMAENLSLRQVQFRGHVNDVQSIWKDNHMLVLPSRFEGLPLSLVECMWSARPAVVTDIGGNAELCVDGETGFVSAAPTFSLLNEALERAWARRGAWKGLGVAARKRVEQLMPEEPVAEFCNRLLRCIAEAKANG